MFLELKKASLSVRTGCRVSIGDDISIPTLYKMFLKNLWKKFKKYFRKLLKYRELP